jgi:hypothetical protein
MSIPDDGKLVAAGDLCGAFGDGAEGDDVDVERPALLSIAVPAGDGQLERADRQVASGEPELGLMHDASAQADGVEFGFAVAVAAAASTLANRWGYRCQSVAAFADG